VIEHRALLIMDLNPEPWTPGTASMGFKGKQRYAKISKDERLRNYQEGVRENIMQAYPDLPMLFSAGIELHLICKFWRQLDKYTSGTGRQAQRHVADATNLTKAVEDALQTIFYKNDNQVKHSEGEIIMEGEDVAPRILILVKERVRDPRWQELANQLEVREMPSPPGNVYYTRLVS
jgi:Holliday junction resolvase RusA-like endonuclease